MDGLYKTHDFGLRVWNIPTVQPHCISFIGGDTGEALKSILKFFPEKISHVKNDLDPDFDHQTNCRFDGT